MIQSSLQPLLMVSLNFIHRKQIWKMKVGNRSAQKCFWVDFLLTKWVMGREGRGAIWYNPWYGHFGKYWYWFCQIYWYWFENLDIALLYDETFSSDGYGEPQAPPVTEAPLPTYSGWEFCQIMSWLFLFITIYDHNSIKIALDNLFPF